MTDLLFDTWAGLGRVILAALLGYVALVAILRVSGKRTLAKMSAFDLVVTVALGSTLATLVLSRDTPIFEGVLAFMVLIGLQWVVAWSSVRSRRVERIVKSEPRLLYFRGEALEDALQAERVTHEEVLAAVRTSGAAGLSDVEAVVLETDGTFSVLQSTTRSSKKEPDPSAWPQPPRPAN